MAERLEVYKCEVCGNIVEVLHGGKGELVCCGKPMVQLVENTVDAAKLAPSTKLLDRNLIKPRTPPLLLFYWL